MSVVDEGARGDGRAVIAGWGTAADRGRSGDGTRLRRCWRTHGGGEEDEEEGEEAEQ